MLQLLHSSTSHSTSSRRTPTLQSSLHLAPRRGTTSSSQMVVGNAANAKTTTSREERPASGARSQRLRLTTKESQSTWPVSSRTRNSRRPRLRSSMKFLILSSTTSSTKIIAYTSTKLCKTLLSPNLNPNPS